MQPETYTFPDVPSEIEFKPIVEPGPSAEKLARPKSKRRLGTRVARLSLLVALIAGMINGYGNWYGGRGDREAARIAQSQTAAALSTLAVFEAKSERLLEDDFGDTKAPALPAKTSTNDAALPAANAAAATPATSPAEKPTPAQASSPPDAVAPVAEKPVVSAGTVSPPAKDAAAASEPTPVISTPLPQPLQVAEPVAPQPAGHDTKPWPQPSETGALFPTAAPAASAETAASEPAPLLGKLPAAEGEQADTAARPAARPRLAQRAPEQKGVVCFAGCHGLEQRVVYDRPAPAMETMAPRPQLQLAALGEASNGRQRELPNAARRGSCIAGCYGHSRPVRINRPAVAIPARWEIESVYWGDYVRPHRRHSAARHHARRRNS